MEDGRYAQTFVDAGQADPAVQFFVPVVDAPLLVVEGHAPKPGRSERFLYRLHERDVLVDAGRSWRPGSPKEDGAGRVPDQG